MYNEISSSTVTNCILWGNSPDEIYNNSSSPTVSYCDVQGGYGEGEGNNIDADPCFADAASGDFHLLFGSPCIDAGTNSAASLPSTDFEGDNRIINGIVDMGADEYICDPAILPSPADGASMVSVDVQLSWTAGVGSVSHDVWFGTENPPTTLIADDITETNTDPGVLEYGVTYYWQVDENTSEGTVTGDVWSFRTEIPDIWVDDDYTYDGLNDGHTWGIDAFANIGAGIDMAEYGTTVHVAAGVYMENITLKNGVALIGAGTGSALIYAGGSGRVVYSSGCDANTILEGFIITGGYSSYGGGMYNKGSSPTVASCTFTGNTAFWDDYGGGGMFNNASSNPIVTNCTFIDNLAGCQGGGMYNYNSSSPTVTNCTFSGNSANFCGGGMCNYSDSNPTLTNCAFSRNSATYYGGGMFNNASSSPTVTNCTFSGNTATNDGGGMYNYRNSNPTLTNCAFSGNSSDFGGGMYNFNSSSPTITNCTFSDNSAGQYGGGMYNSDNSTPTLTNCIMWGNSAVNSPIEIYNINSTPVISFSDIAFCGGSGAGWMGFMGVDGGGNIDKDPLFGGDLHLKSEFGRATTDPSLPFGTWVVDTVTSPCIDAGDPNMAVGNEPEGNGGRINMGYYGGTYHASKSSYVGTIEGDVNGDGKVDFLDFAIMAENWLIDCDVEPSNPECIPK
jgi:parallel beta-helix repeat protein